jgi:hypothetical protein
MRSGARRYLPGRRLAAHEVEQVRPLDLVELDGPRNRFEHVLGDAPDVASFELDEVLDADAGEKRHLLAPQLGDPSPARRRATQPAQG